MERSRDTRPAVHVLGAVVSLLLASCTTPTQHVERDVVFICEHGAAKSVIAAAYFNRAALERGLAVRARARGADPQREPSVRAMAGLAADGFATSSEAPRPLMRADLQTPVQVIVFDCGAPAMVPLRQVGECWNDTPAISGGYEATRDAIRAHVGELVEQIERRGSRRPAR